MGLLRLEPWAIRLIYGFTGFQTLLAGAVAGMAIRMALRDDPSASMVLLVVTVTFTAALAGVFVLLLRLPEGERRMRTTVGA